MTTMNRLLLALALFQGAAAQEDGIHQESMGLCFAEQGVCFYRGDDGAAHGPAPLRNPSDAADYLIGTLIGSGPMMFSECFCRGGRSFHFHYREGDTDCSSNCFGHVQDVMDSNTGEVVAVSALVPLDIPFATAGDPRRLRGTDKTERSLQFAGVPTQTVELPVCAAGMMGDPHVHKWSGEWFEWHGECDTVFLHAPDFAEGMGLDIHTRTRIRYDYSYIETVAIQIGDDVMEISSFGQYRINSVESADIKQTLANNYTVTHETLSSSQHIFKVHLGHGTTIEAMTLKDIVNIKVKHGSNPIIKEWFGKSTGMMGEFQSGKTLGRDGLTVVEDPNDLGQEWQVQGNDPLLFEDQTRAPQYPAKCKLPPSMEAAKKHL